MLYLLCHHSRVELAIGAAGPADCWLERWYQQEAERAVRALDRLHKGVIDALRILGEGFVAHKGSDKLRSELNDGGLKPEEYLRLLMRLVFRLLFCLVAEERGLLPIPDAHPRVKERTNATSLCATYARWLDVVPAPPTRTGGMPCSASSSARSPRTLGAPVWGCPPSTRNCSMLAPSASLRIQS